MVGRQLAPVRVSHHHPAPLHHHHAMMLHYLFHTLLHHFIAPYYSVPVLAPFTFLLAPCCTVLAPPNLVTPQHLALRAPCYNLSLSHRVFSDNQSPDYEHHEVPPHSAPAINSETCDTIISHHFSAVIKLFFVSDVFLYFFGLLHINTSALTIF